MLCSCNIMPFETKRKKRVNKWPFALKDVFFLLPLLVADVCAEIVCAETLFPTLFRVSE
jgi:hypothetical protein